jgi:peptidyl-prolyl cis-trans isomerase A (cyclophilin A)
MSAPTLSDLDDAMEMKPIPLCGEEEGELSYRDTPSDDEERSSSFDDNDDEIHKDPALKRRSYLPYILIVVAIIFVLVEVIRGGKDASSLHNARTAEEPTSHSISPTSTTEESSSDRLTVEFTVANLRTNSQNCTQVGKMLQCIPQHNNSTNKFRIRLHEDWAPLGVQRFQELTESNFWDDARIFRVVPNFVSQFGISSYPEIQEQWDALGNIPDDKVIGSNTVGTVTFATAGPNTRTTQIFINTANNYFLDKQGFSPIGEVLLAGEGYGGIEVVNEMYQKYGESPDQSNIKREGLDYLEKAFPNLSYFVTAAFV